MAELIWHRFVRDDSDTEDDGEDVRAWELARDGATLLVRKVGRNNRASSESKWMASVDRAERALKRQMREVQQQGYREDGTVTRPAPMPRTQRPRRERPSTRAAQWAQARQAFDAQLPAFVQGWRALGFNEALGFAEQCRGSRRHPNEVAESCLELAGRIFGVDFARRTRTFDSEHGYAKSISNRDLADYYASPAVVLTKIYARLRGDIVATDDADLPGFAEECRQQMQMLPAIDESSATTPPAPASSPVSGSSGRTS